MPTLSWKVVVIFVALLVSINLTLYFVEDGWQVVQPFINMIGIIIAVVFAKDSVDKNYATKQEIVRVAEETTVEINRAKVEAATAVKVAKEAALHAAKVAETSAVEIVQMLPTKPVAELHDDDAVIVKENGQ